jgi:hypothetical protein
MKTHRTLLCMFWILAFTAACRSKHGGELMGGLFSYETVEQVRNQLSAINPGQKWIEQSAPDDPTDRRPQHRFVYLHGDFQDLGCRGQLRLTFYNNRLNGCRILAI